MSATTEAGLMMRWINRAGTAVIAALIIAGPPVAVTLWLGNQRWQPPTLDRILYWLDQPPTAGMLAALLGGILSVGWLLLVFVIVSRTWRVLVGKVRRLRRLPLPTTTQMTASSMAGVAVLTLPTAVAPDPADTAPASAAAESGSSLPQASIERAGVELPGGVWVPYRTAVVVTLLGGAIWLHRRHHYQPRNLQAGRRRDDSDLQPLPETVEAMIAAVDEQPANTAVSGSLLPADLPTGVLVLHGPGALHAARGLLITTLLTNALPGGAQTAVTIHPDDLGTLLDAARALADPPAGLRLDPASLEAVRRPGRDGARTPALLLTPAPSPSAPADPGEATIVVVDGDPGEGQRWNVAADGTVTGVPPGREQRLCLLDRAAATDLLRLVQQHADTTPVPPGHPVAPAPEEQPSRPAQLRLLGGCRLAVHGSTVHIRRSAGLQILAYLAVHPDGATTTDLIRAVWPGLNPTTITKRLHTTLTDLRQQLQHLGDVIVRHDDRYRLNTDLMDTDLDQLQRAVTAATTAVTAQQRQAAGQAITDADHGELAAGYSWPWLHHPRETLRRDLIDAYLSLAAAATPAEAVDLVRAATAADPYNRAVHERAHHILTTAGHHDAARALHQQLTQRLLAAGLRPADTEAEHPAAKDADLRL